MRRRARPRRGERPRPRAHRSPRNARRAPRGSLRSLARGCAAPRTGRRPGGSRRACTRPSPARGQEGRRQRVVDRGERRRARASRASCRAAPGAPRSRPPRCSSRAARFHRLRREELLERERVEHGLERLAAADHHAFLARARCRSCDRWRAARRPRAARPGRSSRAAATPPRWPARACCADPRGRGRSRPKASSKCAGTQPPGASAIRRSQTRRSARIAPIPSCHTRSIAGASSSRSCACTRSIVPSSTRRARAPRCPT